MKNSTATIEVACAIVFLIFVFCYVYFLQSDLLTFIQHVWSGGQTHYNITVGAVIFTASLFLVHLCVKAIFNLPSYMKSATYFPSLLFIGSLTNVSLTSNGGIELGPWWWISIILLIPYLIVLKPFSELGNLEKHVRQHSLLSRTSWINFLILSMMMLLCVSIGNTDKHLHERLKMENCIDERNYTKVIEISSSAVINDSSMVMMRALALSKEGKLGDEMFKATLLGGSAALIPHMDYSTCFLFADDQRLWRNLGAVPSEEFESTQAFLLKLQKDSIARPAVKDYLLTAYLLDKDLKGFVKQMIAYQSADTTLTHPADSFTTVLPRHYREALVLYTHLHSQRLTTYTDEVLDADYEDFQAMMRRKYKTPEARKKALREQYKNTYWEYYFNSL